VSLSSLNRHAVATRGDVGISKVNWEGVNHCSLPCRRLAKFRGLMYRVNYSDVIGLKKPTACIFILGTFKKRVSRPITAPYLTLYI